MVFFVFLCLLLLNIEASITEDELTLRRALKIDPRFKNQQLVFEKAIEFNNLSLEQTFFICVDMQHASKTSTMLRGISEPIKAMGVQTIYASKSESKTCFIIHGTSSNMKVLMVLCGHISLIS